MKLQHVARGARNVGDDRHVATGKPVEQRRFADVGCTDDRHLKALADTFRRRGTVELGPDLIGDTMHQRQNLWRHLVERVFLGEIYAGRHQRAGCDQIVAPVPGLSPQIASGEAHRLAALRLGLGSQQVADALNLGQVNAAGEECTPRKLSGLGQARPAALQGVSESRDNDRCAVEVEFDHRIAGEAGARIEPQHQTFVEDLALVPEFAQDGSPRRGKSARQIGRNSERFRSAQADDGHASAAGRRRLGVDRVHRFTRRSSNRRTRHWTWSA